MLNLWTFIAVEFHLFHNIVTVKKSTKGCKIWQGGVEYGKGCNIWQVNLTIYYTPMHFMWGVKSGATPGTVDSASSVMLENPLTTVKLAQTAVQSAVKDNKQPPELILTQGYVNTDSSFSE